MRTPICVLVATCLSWASLDARFSAALAQGSLTPPGAPAPTFRTLTQIEPRTPISTLPFTISSPGSYYLTTNLSGVNGNSGITVASDSVTLDLNGFALFGVTGSGSGLICSGSRIRLCVRNGVVRGWGDHGIDASQAQDCDIEGLEFLANGQSGLRSGQHALINRCIARGNGTNGIVTADKCAVKNCNAVLNSSNGIVAGAYCIITECVAGNNGANGMVTGFNAVIRDCVVEFNASNGVVVAAGGMVSGCTAQNNTLDGIQVGFGTYVLNNHCGDNAVGIHFTSSEGRADGNNCPENFTAGIKSDTPGNFIIRNSGKPYHETPGLLGPTNLPPISATSPWANF
jgi:hypothetical protein